jgi:hypothetical protein
MSYQATKIHEKVFLNERHQSEESYILYNINYVMFWTKKNCGDSRRKKTVSELLRGWKE